MRTFDGGPLALLASGRMVMHALVQFDFGGTYGFWDGAGRLEWSGLTYVGAGSLMGIDEVEYARSLHLATATAPTSYRLFPPAQR